MLVYLLIYNRIRVIRYTRYTTLTLRPLQISRNLSTSTTSESDTQGSSNPTVAMYKGLKVAVYTVDKTEIILTRQDLVELVNVRVVSCSHIVFHISRQVSP